MASPDKQAIEEKSAEKEVAVVPLESIDVQEVAYAARLLDGFLRRTTRDVVTVDRVATVASAVPTLANIMAIIDVMVDVFTLATRKVETKLESLRNWASLAANLMAIVPGQGGAARVALRPTLTLARQAVKTAAHAIDESLMVMLEAHLHATLAGTIDTYVKEALSRLGPMLDAAGAKLKEITDSLSAALTRLANGQVFLVKVTPEPAMSTSEKEYKNAFAALLGAFGAGAKALQEETARRFKAGGNAAFAAAVDAAGVKQPMLDLAGQVQRLGLESKQFLAQQRDGSLDMSIAFVLTKLEAAAVAYVHKQGRVGRAATVGADKAVHLRELPGVELGQKAAEPPTGADPGCGCGAQTRTGGSIGFGTGSETISHTDFALPGHAPIVWTRTYYSRLGAYDAPNHGANAAVPAYLGARWTTAYTTRIDQAADGTLTYHGADGRSHVFPRLAGQSEHDPRQTGDKFHNAIEDLTLGRSDDRLLVLGHGRDYVETFELCPAFWNNGQPRSRGRAVSYRLTAQRNATGHVTELQYRHPGGQLSDIISPNAHVSTAIDAAGRIEELWLVENNQAVRMLADYAYETRADGSADMTAAKDENEAIWHYGYLGETHLLDRYTDRTDRAFFLKWMHPDGFDTPLTPTNSAKARAYHERAGDGSFETTLIWNKHIRMTTIIDAHGAEMRYYCDVLGYPYRIVHPEVTAPDGSIYAHEEWLVRDQNKNVTMHVRPDGSFETYTYDAHDNLIRNQRADASVVHFAYDGKDNLTGILDAEGKAWTRAYDGILLVEETDPLGHVTQYAYDEAGQLVEITDAKGGKKKLAYDEAGQLTAYTDCSGKTSRWEYNERGRLAKAINAAGEATRYYYDEGRLSSIEHADRTREHLEYDAESRLLLHRDALQRETRYEYSEAGQISRRIDANRNILEYRWDRIGRLAELRNENARSHHFRYDPAGKLTSEVHFDDIRTDYHYLPESGVLHQIVEGDSVTQVEFDPVGRLSSRMIGVFLPRAATNSGKRQVDKSTVQLDEYDYDGNGRLIQAENKDIRLQWFHDAAGNTTTEHQHWAIDRDGPAKQIGTAVWKHQYDELGTRIRTTRPDGHVTSWLTYGSGHVHGLMLDDLGAIHFERDDLHREIKRVQANLLAEDRKYDPAGRLQSQVLKRVEQLSQTAPGVARFNVTRSYRYDQAGQLTDISDSRRGQLSYHYDPVSRLIQAHSQLGTETFAFDPASNLIDPDARGHAETPRVNGIPALLDNLLRDYAGTHFDYDQRGNMIRRVHNGVETLFTWTPGNRLLEVIEPGQKKTQYCYDPLGRRIAKYSSSLRPRDQALRGDRNAVLFGWDGDQMVWESDSLRKQTVHYFYEPNSFVPMLQASTTKDIRKIFLVRPHDIAGTYANADGDYDMDRDPLYNGDYVPGVTEDGEGPGPLGGLYFYQCDHLGTPMALTDADGQVAWEANYKAWGEAKVTIARAARMAGVANSIRFQGQYFDEESGLQYNRFRYYEPSAGRYVCRDPIGLLGGLNLYSYVLSNPVGLIDVYGLQAFPGSLFTQGVNPAYAQYMSNPSLTTTDYGDHHYSIWIPLCTFCTPADAFNAMRNFSAPGAPYANDGTHVSVLTGGNPIQQTVDSCNLTITNQTLPGHFFGGKVVISITENSGAVGAQIVGSGVGPNSNLNQIFGPAVFGLLGFEAGLTLNPQPAF